MSPVETVQEQPSSGLLSYPQAAAILGVSQKTLQRLVAKRKVRCLRPAPHSVRFRPVDLDRYLARTANTN